jgi:hypothetical protein
MQIKQNRFLALALLLALMAGFVLSACGETPTATTAAATSAATTAATTSVTTTVVGTTSAATTAASTTSAATTSAATTAAGTTSAATTSVATTVAGTTTGAATTAASASSDTSPKVVDAANAFLATLDNTQKSAVLFDYSNTAQKSRWSNLPEGLFTRQGLMWGNLTEPQRQAWLNIMSTTLSKLGYQRFLDAWNADNALFTGDGGGGQGNKYGTQYYWVALIGTPSTTSAWQWQFGGHHYTYNATIVDSNIALTPSFIGAQPASYTTSSGQTVRPLGDIQDASFALLNSLDATQKAKAVKGSSTIDVVLGPGQDGKTLTAEGLPGSEMTAEQQTAFLNLIGLYNNMLNDEDAATRLADLKAKLPQTYFAWYGPTTGPNGYFRVTGPSVVIEYSPQSMGGGGRPGGAATTTTAAASGTSAASTTTHVHGIYRDPTNDYGVGYINK